MTDLELDLEEEEDKKSDAVGALDRLILGAGLVVVAVFPTLFYVIAMPWRAAPLLAGETPKGRAGVIIGPGVFFVAGMLLLTIIINTISNFSPEAVPSVDDIATVDLTQLDMPAEDEEDGRSGRVLGALAEGNIWEAAVQLAPIFVITCLLGAVSAGVGRFVSPRWTVRAAVGGALYQVTVLLLIVALIFGIPDNLGWEPESGDPLIIVLGAVWFGTLLLLMPWQYFWFLHRYTGARKHVCGLATVGMLATGVVAMYATAVFVFLAETG